MEDIKCRICLQYSECHFRLDDTIEGQLIWEAINEIAAVFVAIGDSFPQSVCLDCSQKLEQAIRFKNEVERSDKLLHNNEFEYVSFIKTEIDEGDPILAEESTAEHMNNVLEPAVIIKSKRGRTIKRKKYDEEEEEDVKVDIKEQNIQIKSDPQEDSETGEEETSVLDIKKEPNLSRKRKRRSKIIEYRCCMCQEQFPDDDSLISHVETSHSQQVAINQDKKFTTRQIHTCKYCRLKFRSTKYMNLHFDTPNYKEPPRKRTYKPKPKVNQNIICTYCGKISADIYESRMHELRVHAEDCPIVCTFPGCNKRFAAEIIMKKHRRIHAEKTHVCNVCGKAFQIKRYLLKHEYVHKDEKPLKCQFCPKTFIHKNALKAHEDFHTTEKIHSCDQCGKIYKWKEDLLKHVRGVHLGDHPYKCKWCSKGYFCSSSRKYHQDRCPSASESLLNLKLLNE